MTNLLIGYPDIPLRSTAISYIAGTEDASYPLSNSVGGSRSEFIKLSATAPQAAIEYDLGASVTAQAEYFFVAGANLSKSLGAETMKLVSWDGVSEVDIVGCDLNLLSNGVFSGPRGEDFLGTDGFNDKLGGTIPSVATRYFRVYIGDGASDQKWAVRKINFGMWFDFDRDPIYPVMVKRQVGAQSWRESPYEFTCTWLGISDAKRTSFVDKIAAPRDYQTLVLYDVDDLMLHGFKTLHCRLKEFRITPIVYNNSTIECTFEEVL